MIFSLLFVACFGLSAAYESLNLLEDIKDEWINLPTADGGWRNFHRSELEEILDIEPYPFDPYNEMIFYLWTPQNPNSPQIVKIDDAASLATSNFNPNWPTRFMVHGWNGNGLTDGAIIRPKNAYLSLGNYNFFGVDWGAGAQTSNYIAAADRVGVAGANVAKFIQFIISETSSNIANFQVVGFSLGGHVVGHIGKNMPSGMRMQRIVSLDPAGPLFSLSNVDKRVDAADGDYVEVIHSNKGENGFQNPIGDADFYPNGGGMTQPGCSIADPGCSHSRAVLYFTESLTTNVGFVARPCSSYDSVSKDGCSFTTGQNVKMGGEPLLSSTKRGVYWLETKSESPFAQG